MSTIQTMYSCNTCGLERQPVPIEERGADEDVKPFVERIAAAAGSDHVFRSRGCPATKVDIWIPVPKGTDRIGENVKS